MTVGPHTARSVQCWFEEHEDVLQHPLWLAQSPNLNIIEPLWSVLESLAGSRLPPLSSLKQPGDVLRQEWYSIPVEVIQNLGESILRKIKLYYRQMVAHLRINKEMCICHYCLQVRSQLSFYVELYVYVLIPHSVY